MTQLPVSSGGSSVVLQVLFFWFPYRCVRVWSDLVDRRSWSIFSNKKGLVSPRQCLAVTVSPRHLEITDIALPSFQARLSRQFQKSDYRWKIGITRKNGKNSISLKSIFPIHVSQIFVSGANLWHCLESGCLLEPKVGRKSSTLVGLGEWAIIVAFLSGWVAACCVEGKLLKVSQGRGCPKLLQYT